MSALTRTRLASAAVYFMLLVLLPLVSCSSTPAPAKSRERTTRSSGPSTLLAPSPVSASPVSADPALQAAVLFEQAHCGWDWHESQRAYLAGQQQLATASYGAQLAAAADPTSWQHGVIEQKQTVTCVISGAARFADAPATTTAVYVRMTVNSEITSTLGTFAGGQRIASWLVRRVGGRWLVAGSFDGG